MLDASAVPASVSSRRKRAVSLIVGAALLLLAVRLLLPWLLARAVTPCAGPLPRRVHRAHYPERQTRLSRRRLGVGAHGEPIARPPRFDEENEAGRISLSLQDPFARHGSDRALPESVEKEVAIGGQTPTAVAIRTRRRR